MNAPTGSHRWASSWGRGAGAGSRCFTAWVRYVVIGAGAIGGTIGGRLGQHGHEVVLVARGSHADRLREKGLRLLTPTGPVELNAPVANSPADVVLTPDDVLVLAVKVQDAAGLLADWAAAPVGDSTAGHELPIVCAQNGVEGERLALRWFRRVVGVCVFLPATHLEPGVVSSEGAPVSGGFVLGRYPRGRDELVEQIAADLAGAGFATIVSDDVMAAKRGKLIDNTGNALDAVCRPEDGSDALRRRPGRKGSGSWRPRERHRWAGPRPCRNSPRSASTPPPSRAANGSGPPAGRACTAGAPSRPTGSTARSSGSVASTGWRHRSTRRSRSWPTPPCGEASGPGPSGCRTSRRSWRASGGTRRLPPGPT